MPKHNPWSPHANPWSPHAEDDTCDDWVACCESRIRSLAGRKNMGWDEVRSYLEKHCGLNPNPPSWGGLARRWRNQGILKDTALTKITSIVHDHGRSVRVYDIY